MIRTCEKTVVIHQPDFLPHPGFFHRLLRADIFIVLDHVPISKRGWVHRDRIKTAAGADWITVPVKNIGAQPPINEAEIDYNHHFDRIERLIRAHYAQAPFFAEIFPPLQEVLSRRPRLLIDLNLALLDLLLGWLDIPVGQPPRSSAFGLRSRRSQMNADLVKAVGGNAYLSGQGARGYHEDRPFTEAGIEVIWQDFRPPVYPQLHDGFIPALSSIDLLFNCGSERSKSILRSC